MALGASGRPTLSREDADRELVRLRDERDRISAALLDLEGHQGYQFLKGGDLTGETARRWTSASGQTTALWELFDAFRFQLDRAESIRAEQHRLSQDRLERLTGLLTGDSVELAGQQLPIEQRSLLGPATERLSMADVVARMTGLFEQATETVAAVDTVWSALLTALQPLDEGHAQAQRLAATLEVTDPELTAWGGRYTGLRGRVVADPMGLTRQAFGRTQADTHLMDELAAELAPIRARLEQSVQMRVDHGERTKALRDAIELVATTESETRQIREVVQIKIRTPVLPEATDLAAGLSERLRALDELRATGRWAELAAAATELDRAAADALGLARTARESLSGLLDRRAELRGRLEAYRAKAAHLGRGEDLELTRLYEQARVLLWTAPCDLRQATQALAGYQRAITSPADGASR